MFKITSLIVILILISTNTFSKEIEILSDIPGRGIEIKNHYKDHVNYIGLLESGLEFDSSYKREKPFVFQIGLKQVILGWEKGLMGMKVGGKRTIKIPPELGYGSKKVGELIPPNSTLIFELEIVNAFKPSYKLISSYDLIKKKESLIIIDIRTNKEIKRTGTIEKSIPITAFDLNGKFNQEFLKNLEKISSKTDHIVFISDKGRISSNLANGFAEQLNYKFIYSLEGGIKKWIKEGNEIFNN